ncbi:hypothetical protein AB6N23_13900 [Cellulomonas sp. 179-A 9B4 NHS]|uniref:hypothetical protein n=1 Tax=Cellulomonas sp. 179-A 9B4 NHS TaxID=3142379 RepID=UPI0039A183F6
MRLRPAATWVPALLASVAVAVCWASLGAPRESPEGHSCAADPLTGLTVDSQDGPDPSCLGVNRTAGARTAAVALTVSAGGVVLAVRRRGTPADGPAATDVTAGRAAR